MSEISIRRIALVGNPNSGKSTLFNHLTGLRQKIGNYPGVTVDKKSGVLRLPEGQDITIQDFPGSYSIYPRSADEKVVPEILTNPGHPDYPDLVIVTIDASNIKRGLLLLTQVVDLGLPAICVLNMIDVAEKRGFTIDIPLLAQRLGIPVVAMNSRKGLGSSELLSSLKNAAVREPFYQEIPSALLDAISDRFAIQATYKANILLNQSGTLGYLNDEDRLFLSDLKQSHSAEIRMLQQQEILARYKIIDRLLEGILVKQDESKRIRFSQRLDRILTHPILGYLLFFGILFVLFQALFSWAEAPMDWIDMAFASLSAAVKSSLPEGPFVNMIAEGLIPGIGGIVIFIPQIALLFAFISVLEESGYMARVVMLMDKLMRPFGLNGKSVVPLISGVACAIPAVMSARTIENWKERMITIMVTPLMTCSARLPVYVILIALVIPAKTWMGFNLQGVILFGLYFMGFAVAMLAALVFRAILKSRAPGFLVMEMPLYRVPQLKNVGFVMYEKSRTFVVEAGKIILAISLILWVLASYGPGDHIRNAEQEVVEKYDITRDHESFASTVASYKLEHSYAAVMGKAIEPMIKPLGFDWKIGIALITSFAAREVFVSTIATIYSVGDAATDDTIRQKMAKEVHPETGEKVYTLPVAFALLVFYAFAMQCMSTLAIVYRETKSIKWPIIQLGYMSVLAYVSAMVTYHVLNSYL